MFESKPKHAFREWHINGFPKNSSSIRADIPETSLVRFIEFQAQNLSIRDL